MKTWLELSSQNLVHNVTEIRSLLSEGVVFCAVVKANAYGHGLNEIVSILATNGVKHFAVDSIDEAQQVRKLATNAEIFILGWTDKERHKDVVRGNFIQVTYDQDTIESLADAAVHFQKKARISIKIETGTHRQGVGESVLFELLTLLKQYESEIELSSIHSHFANAEDLIDTQYTFDQNDEFQRISYMVFKRGFKPQYVHIACSAAAIAHPDTQYNLVRTGIALYGLWSSESLRKKNIISSTSITLKPVLAWKTKIAQTKDVKAGELIGYGCTYKADKPMRIAIIPIGYYDGYIRQYRDNGRVLVHGQSCRILGTICMNMCMIDISTVPQASQADIVTIIGRDGMQEISAEEFANISDTINYEVVTRIGPHIPKQIM